MMINNSCLWLEKTVFDFLKLFLLNFTSANNDCSSFQIQFSFAMFCFSCRVICFLIGHVTILRHRRDMTRSMSCSLHSKKNLDRFDGHMMIRVFDRYVLMMSPLASPLQLNICRSIKIVKGSLNLEHRKYIALCEQIFVNVFVVNLRRLFKLTQIDQYSLVIVLLLHMFTKTNR